jgi:prepilin signal peptidase PulO-like enzyme (type II secretory pathway)
MIGIFVAVVVFGCVAFVGVDLSRIVCARISPLDGAPPLGEPPVAVLVAAAGLIAALLVIRGAGTTQMIGSAVVVLALAAGWSSDSLRGLLPDVFTLAPLGVLLLLAITQRDWLVFLSAAIAFVPFAAAAAFTHGRGMGWGDAKLAALAGAALGAPLAILAMIVACLAAVVGYRVKRIASGPIAFAPYIAAAVGIAIPLSVGH